jgi:tRNA (uracil-5-)-methyltransferase TRM9
MNDAVGLKLLQVNRDFYATVAEPFHQTRIAWTPGKSQLLTYVPDTDGKALAVADIGCGNGRFAVMLDSLEVESNYCGVDGDVDLLERAAAQATTLTHVDCRFEHADLSQPGWLEALAQASFNMVICLATLQHMPGYDLRVRLVRELASLLAPDGLLAISAWQFLESERFRKRLVDWSEVGLTAADVEPGDALLPWKQGVYAVRYVHQIDETEMDRLVAEAGFTVVDTYRADGKEGNLNLYLILSRSQQKRALPQIGTDDFG